MSAAPLNPFASQTVSSLRKIEPPLRWLNDSALRKLIAIFELVEEKPHRCELVQPVLSKGDGYGKSHLLGRLVHDLDDRATCVSVAPHHDPLTCWVTLLQSMLNELSQPGLIQQLPYPPTVLDELAHQLFGFLTVMLADKGMTDRPIPGGQRDEILAGAFEKWDLADPASPLGVWVNETLSACEQDAEREAIIVRLLKAATLHPYNDDASAMNWLLVLHRYAGDRTDEDSRQMCLDWILTNQLEIPAETFLQNEAQLDGINLIARQQTLDLLALAKLHRPFLLCFDQTHSLSSALAKSFGNMLLDLIRAEGAHFSIVTANTNHWESTVLPEFSADCLPCLATRMELAGLTREQGRSLAEQRLQGNGDPVELQERFLKKDWLQEQFAQGLLGQREFLRRCQARYQELVPEAINPPDDAETPEPEALRVAPLLPAELPAIPTPEFNTTADATTNIEAPPVAPQPLPPVPALVVADAEPEKSDPVLEQPIERVSASSETDPIPTPPVGEALTPAEITDTIGESKVAPVEASLKEQDTGSVTSQISSPSVIEPATPTENSAPLSEANVAPVEASRNEQDTGSATPQISTPSVIEPATPAEISNTISESSTATVEAPLKELDAERATSEPPSTSEQVSTPEITTGQSVLSAPSNLEKTPYASESSTLIPLLPSTFSALTPLVDIPENQMEKGTESALPSVLLPPAQEDFLNEPIETSNTSDTEKPVPSLQELANSLAEPEKPAAGRSPPAIASSVLETEQPVPDELPVEAAPTAEWQETKETSPESESVALEPPTTPESSGETIPDIVTDSTGTIPDTASKEEVEQTISDVPPVVDEPVIPPTPEVEAVLLAEIEPQILETAPDTTNGSENSPVAELPDWAAPALIEGTNEPDTIIVEESTPVAENALVPEPEPVVAAVVPVNDQEELREALFQIIKAHRFASHIAIADELRRKLQRSVTAEEAVLCAQSISEIHVYADGPNVAFLWQGGD